MLTDIFADRYAAVILWNEFQEPQRRLIVQSFRILEESICPYWIDGKESERGKTFWSSLHNRLSMELGVKSLSEPGYSYQQNWNGTVHTVAGLYTTNIVCQNWMLKTFDGTCSADRFIKERLSLVEIGFRIKAEEVALANAGLPAEIKAAKNSALVQTYKALRLPGDPVDGVKAANTKLNTDYRDAANELNARLRQAGTNLNYHNGFIQQNDDLLLLRQIELPFWKLVSDPLWKNIDTDMKEAIDRRDSGERDPAFYAARALESAIKIISDEKRWTHGKEKGAHNYIDNLQSKSAKFITDWEADSLKAFFTKVRNPFGHGPGKNDMPKLTPTQTDWAIETSMAWIKSLIRRL